jgi:hypothetical protein
MHKIFQSKSSVQKQKISPKVITLTLFWFSLSLLITFGFGIDSLRLAFSGDYIVQDDARQHVFWMQKFIDPELFQNDSIADYFQSIAPLGFTCLYKLATIFGIEPFTFNKILPLFLGLITSGYCFGICLEIIPIPTAAFFSSLFLNVNLWLMDSLSSGTPRSFVYPIFLAFIYYLLKRSLIACLLTIVLQAQFYPQTIFVSIILLLLQLFSCKQQQLKLIKKNIILVFSSLSIALISLFVYAPSSSKFAPILTAEIAKHLPEFAEEGRSAFFLNNSLFFWFLAPRSGLFPHEWLYAWSYISFCVFFCCLGLLIASLDRQKTYFPLLKKINDKSAIFGQIAIASLVLFFLAHLFLFKLHLPSRYTQHSIRIIMALGDGITIAILIDGIARYLSKYIGRANTIKNIATILFIFLMLVPVYVAKHHPLYLKALGYLQGEAPSLYQFLQHQPKDSVIASLTEEADFIPSFTGRSVLVSEEYSIPYHQGYYQQIFQRTKDLIDAQYSISWGKIVQFIQKYRINLWLLDRHAFEPSYLEKNPWLKQFKNETNRAIANLNNKQTPLLQKTQDRCKVFEEENLILIETQCLLNSNN